MGELITEEWLAESDFKYTQEERQPHKHWTLWLGSAIEDNLTDAQSIGIEVTMAWWYNRYDEKIGNVDGWNCWLKSHHPGYKHIHIRHLKYKHELIAICESLTGITWHPEFNLYGMMNTERRYQLLTKDPIHNHD